MPWRSCSGVREELDSARVLTRRRGFSPGARVPTSETKPPRDLRGVGGRGGRIPGGGLERVPAGHHKARSRRTGRGCEPGAPRKAAGVPQGASAGFAGPRVGQRLLDPPRECLSLFPELVLLVQQIVGQRKRRHDGGLPRIHVGPGRRSAACVRRPWPRSGACTPRSRRSAACTCCPRFQPGRS